MRHIALVSCLSLAVLSSCTDAGRPLVIIQNQVPDDGCIVPSSASANFRGVGTADVNSPGGYLFFPLVQNVADGNKNDLSERVAQMRGADVTVEFQNGVLPEVLPELIERDLKLTHPFSGTINPDGDTTGFAFEVVTESMLGAIQDLGALNADGSNFFTLFATVTVFGEMDGGTVESEDFVYPVRVCDGCLLRDLESCEALPVGFVGGGGFVECPGLLQDFVLECCTDAEGTVLCPAKHVDPEDPPM